MTASRRFLLLQIRDDDDPMREQEVVSFARALRCELEQIRTFNLLGGAPNQRTLEQADVLLLGGSGDYSAAGEGPWLDRTLDVLREIHQSAQPTFASCWGFQAFARATGGRVIHAPDRAEVGTVALRITEHGADDPIFSHLDGTFYAQAGHEDCVVELPPDAVRLVSNDRVENQAYRFAGRPIYCTQFHPELSRDDLLGRIRTYPNYVDRIASATPEEVYARCRETPRAEALLRRFVDHVLDGA